jgi:hypothetical protein
MSALTITVSFSWEKALYGLRLALPPQAELACIVGGAKEWRWSVSTVPQLGKYELGAWLVSMLPQKSRLLVKGNKYSSLLILPLES